ncbi:M16 family metallopeptidase [Sphingorhabdus arenilitoris]|uniref:M16 family metallopeptidase n=1 Tax=Sphingorhabdus arenilitoris TaxID=1490041 RepID=A0ABV8RD15_9SPHN
MIRKLSVALLLSATSLTAIPVAAQTAQAAAAEAAPVADLIKAVDIPYENFKLDNGLEVIVHTDRKAPIVAVSVWYRVGSKNEPEGKTGFAHLFEHLMFNGSENAPGDTFEPLQQVGATDLNGTTWFDRTNYFETVPTGALDLALFLESDRMGHLLGAVTQEKLDIQRGVVQNEKRQGDNQPFGLTEYEQLENLYPSGHPYHHSTIGSMADLDSASLEDVKKWFTDNYGPNNAVLVLAGDIDLATAKEKVTKWFGDIPSGPAIKPLDIDVPTLDAPKSKTIKDQVSTTRIYRMWAVPGLNNPDYLPLSMAGSVLGGLASSRLENSLVREQQVAVDVSANAQIFAQGGQFVIYADVKPGVDANLVAAKLDEQIADFLNKGPTDDELQRAVTTYVSGTIRGLEQVGGFSGKAPKLAEGLLYSNNIGEYKVELERAAATTPEQVQQVTRKWLSRPVFSLIVEPGERTEGGENRGGFITAPAMAVGAGALTPEYYFGPDDAKAQKTPIANTGADRSKFPEVGTLQALDFPDIERTTLANGIEVFFAKRSAVPAVQVAVSFDVGYAADPKDALGTQSLMLSLMDEGTKTLNSVQLAEAQERLGANISSRASSDNTIFQLFALKPNLEASVDLLTDLIRNPAMDPAELERVRAQQLNRLSSELTEPFPLAFRTLMPLLFGKDHPYGTPPSGTGDAEVVKQLSRDDLIAFHQKWLRPDKAQVFVVGDTSLSEVSRILNKSLGQWAAPKTAAPQKNFNVKIPEQTSRIVLVNRPKSPQSVIVAAHVIDKKGSDDLVTLRAANDVLGGSFLSRLNTNLRETKNWSYGVGSQITSGKEQISFQIYAPVQADRTGDSITELLKDSNAFLTDKGVTEAELTRTVNGSIRELPGSFETSADVLGGVQNIVNYGRPDDYYEKIADKYRAMTAADVDAAARGDLRTNDLLFVVVGDAETVKPQLDKLGLPIEMAAEAATDSTADKE